MENKSKGTATRKNTRDLSITSTSSGDSGESVVVKKMDASLEAIKMAMNSHITTKTILLERLQEFLLTTSWVNDIPAWL